eukprot:SM000366S13816  [mRNA]  locus=s366:42960:47256:+ [translate_table: standard]
MPPGERRAPLRLSHCASPPHPLSAGGHREDPCSPPPRSCPPPRSAHLEPLGRALLTCIALHWAAPAPRTVPPQLRQPGSGPKPPTFRAPLARARGRLPGPRGDPKPVTQEATASKCPFPHQFFQQDDKERGPQPPSASAARASAAGVQEVPGSWDNPGALRDWLDYFYLQGWHKFATSRMEKYKSTVFKTHIGPDLKKSNLVYILDRASYDILYDNSKVRHLFVAEPVVGKKRPLSRRVDDATRCHRALLGEVVVSSILGAWHIQVEKKDIFFGLYLPDAKTFNNGYRILAEVDPAEEKHKRLKGYCIKLLAVYGPKHVPAAEQLSSFFFDKWEQAIAKDGKVEIYKDLGELMWNWHLIGFESKKAWQPAKPELVSSDFISSWAGPMIIPIMNLPGSAVKDFVTKNLILPSVAKLGLVKPSPQVALAAQLQFYEDNMDEAVKLGMEEPFNLTREEALVNLQFFVSFNSRGAIQGALASTLMQLGVMSGGARHDLMKELTEEAQAAVAKTGGKVTLESVANMPLLESIVYEVFRLHPPVFLQHARMKEDHVITSHTGSYQLYKDEVICGNCWFVSRDPKIFPNPDAFDPRRFLGPNRSNLSNLLWSNGYQTTSVADTMPNKQCPGKDFVPLIVRVFLANFFLRYSFMELTGPTGWNLEKMNQEHDGIDPPIMGNIDIESMRYLQ